MSTYQNWGRVVRHENGGVTVIELTAQNGVPLNIGHLQMPTECIPLDLRPLGSRFFFQWDAIRPEESETTDELRARCRQSFRLLPGNHGENAQND